MPLELAFWIIMLIWLAFGSYINRNSLGVWVGGSIPAFLLFLILGYKVFGHIIQ